MKKSSRILAMVFAMLFVAMVFAGCGGSDNYEKKLIGSWYLRTAGANEPFFTLYPDGTCEIDRYGIGSWEIVNKNQLELTYYDGITIFTEETMVFTIVSIKGDCLTLEGNNGNTVKLWNSPQE